MKSITNLMKGTHRDRRKLNQDNTEKKKALIDMHITRTNFKTDKPKITNKKKKIRNKKSNLKKTENTKFQYKIPNISITFNTLILKISFKINKTFFSPI